MLSVSSENFYLPRTNTVEKSSFKRAVRTLRDGNVISLPYTRPARFGGRKATSCAQCRKRKTKCDLEKPCSTCVARGDSENCSLKTGVIPETPSTSKSEKVAPECGSSSDKSSNLSETSSPMASPSLLAQITFDPTNVGEVVCKSLVKDVCFDQPQSFSSHFDNLGAPALPFTSISHSTDLEGIMALLPTQTQAHISIASYFEFVDPIQHPIHAPSFLRETENFWAKPESVDLAWLAQYLAVCGLGLLSLPTNVIQEAGFTNDDEARILALNWMECAMKSLIICNFSLSPSLATVSALVLLFEFWLIHTDGRHLKGCETLLNTAMGVILDLQLHRDPSHLETKRTDIECEARRRLFWDMFSTEALLTSFIDKSWSVLNLSALDTAPPAEINDDDYDPTGKILPPGPLPFPPIMAPVNLRFAICVVLHKMSTRIFNKGKASYKDVLTLQEELDRISTQLPGLLSRSAGDPSSRKIEMVMKENFRLLAFAYVRLLRPFLNPKFPNPTGEIDMESHRSTCIKHARLLLASYDSSVTRAGFCDNLIPIQGAITLAVHLYENPSDHDHLTIHLELTSFVSKLESGARSALKAKARSVIQSLLFRQESI